MSSEAMQTPLHGVVRIGIGLWIGATTTALLLAISCTGLSGTFEGAPFPIGSKDDALDKPDLLGVWEYSDPEDGSFSRLSFSTYGDRAYRFTLSDEDESDALSGTAFLVDVEGAQILNLELANTPKLQASGYLHFLVSLFPPGSLTLRLVEGGDGMPVPRDDPIALNAFVKEHAHDDSLYGEPVIYQRVALWARTTLYTSFLE